MEKTEILKARGLLVVYEGVIFDPSLADQHMPDITRESRMCYEAYSRKQLEGLLRFALPLLNLWCCALTWPYYNAANLGEEWVVVRC